MGYGPILNFTSALASGVTAGSAIDLGARGWEKIYLKIPSMASSDIYIQSSETVDGTFKRVCVDNANTSTAQIDFVIKSSVSNRIVPIPSYLPCIKIELSSGCTDVVTTFKIIVGG
jgi:hypothetical protein